MNRPIVRSLNTALALFIIGVGTAAADSLESIIESAEATFGGDAYAAERVGGLAEVELLSGNQLIEATYNSDTGALLDSDTFGRPRQVQRIASALDVAVISLEDAIAAADSAVGPGEVLEAELLTSRRNSGERFIVDFRTDSGVFDVIVDSATGQIIRVIRD